MLTVINCSNDGIKLYICESKQLGAYANSEDEAIEIMAKYLALVEETRLLEKGIQALDRLELMYKEGLIPRRYLK